MRSAKAQFKRLEAAVRRGDRRLMRHGRNGRRKTGQALIVAEPAGLPAIYLGEQPKEIRKLPGIYLCETGCDGISGRLKWLAGTCVAGAVGVCMIGVAIYASMNM